MAILQVLTIPDPRLRTKATAIDKVDSSLLSFMDDMIDTMIEYEGIAIAATQVDFHKRAIVVDLGYIQARESGSESSYSGDNIIKMINPEIIWRSEEMVKADEGCLSVPDGYAPVARHKEIKYKYMDESGAWQERSASGLESACVQHEIDHLDGILFIDHISKMRRDKIVRALAKK